MAEKIRAQAWMTAMSRLRTASIIASAAGLVGVARQTDYSASKFAAVGFTESRRNELRAEGSRVRTLVVCPYYIDTGMFEGVHSRLPWLLPVLRQEEVAEEVGGVAVALDVRDEGAWRAALDAVGGDPPAADVAGQDAHRWGSYTS